MVKSEHSINSANHPRVTAGFLMRANSPAIMNRSPGRAKMKTAKPDWITNKQKTEYYQADGCDLAAGNLLPPRNRKSDNHTQRK